MYLGCAPDTFLGAGIQESKKILSNNIIGNIVLGSISMGVAGHEIWHPNPDFYYQYGGGPVLDMGPYYFTALVNLLGPAKNIYSQSRTVYNKRVIGSGERKNQQIKVDIPTTLVSQIEFANGTLIDSFFSFDIWKHNRNHIELYGDRGSINIPDPNTFGGSINICTSKNGEWETIATDKNNLGKIKLNSIFPDDYPWQGKYFIGTTISLDPVPEFENQFLWWMVNNQEIIYEEKLVLYLDSQVLETDSTIFIEAVYSAGPPTEGSVVINEINYNSSDEYNAEDWIEIYNNSESMIDISNWIIKDDNDDHGFEISPNTILPSGAYFVICRDSLTFKNIHPHVNNVIGDLGFGLSGSGDMVRVYDNVGNIVDSVDYNVSEPWPYLPNGYGPTLELKNPDLDNSN